MGDKKLNMLNKRYGQKAKLIFCFLVPALFVSNFSPPHAQTETNPAVIDSGEALASS
jgi:hypothetical protein